MRTIVAELLSVLLTTPDREVLVRSGQVKVRVTREKRDWRDVTVGTFLFP